MKKILFNIYLVFIISLFLQCKENIEKDSYEIINLILMEKVNAYGSKIFPPKSITFGSKNHEKFNDSLINAGKLSYYLVPNFFKLDTLKYYQKKYNSVQEWGDDQYLIVETNPINFSKINKLKIKRLEKLPCKNNFIDNCNEDFTSEFVISNVIFNKKGTKAYVELNFHCGGMCGQGIKFELKRINNKWKITDEKLLWIS